MAGGGFLREGEGETYGERLWVYAVLDHRDADGQRPAVKMAVLFIP